MTRSIADNPLLVVLAADRAAMQAAADSYQPGYDRAQASELADLCYGHLSHRQLAGMVRMLMRDSLCHEPVLTAARDRIAWLAKRVDALEAVGTSIATEHLALAKVAAAVNKQMTDGEAPVSAEVEDAMCELLDIAPHLLGVDAAGAPLDPTP